MSACAYVEVPSLTIGGTDRYYLFTCGLGYHICDARQFASFFCTVIYAVEGT